jgi:hypothetical protein
MSTDTERILAEARAIADRRDAATPRVDYTALNRMVRRQRAALTRAKNSGDLDKLVVTVREAVIEWNQPGSMWPDDWSAWQRALDDALPFHQRVDIRDVGKTQEKI